MVKIEGHNLHPLDHRVTSVTLNGFWVSATIDGKPVDIRTPDHAEWMDKDHRKLTKALEALEQALQVILIPHVPAK